MQIEIELSPAQVKALSYGILDYHELIESMTVGRANQLIEEIVAAEVQRKLTAGEPITGTKDDIVMAAQIESAAERQARYEAEAEARAAEQTQGA